MTSGNSWAKRGQRSLADERSRPPYKDTEKVDDVKMIAFVITVVIIIEVRRIVAMTTNHG